MCKRLLVVLRIRGYSGGDAKASLRLMPSRQSPGYHLAFLGPAHRILGLSNTVSVLGKLPHLLHSSIGVELLNDMAGAQELRHIPPAHSGSASAADLAATAPHALACMLYAALTLVISSPQRKLVYRGDRQQPLLA